VQRDTKEVLAELVGKLKEKLDPKKVVAEHNIKPRQQHLKKKIAQCPKPAIDA
jgi:hypothetical protein